MNKYSYYLCFNDDNKCVAN